MKKARRHDPQHTRRRGRHALITLPTLAGDDIALGGPPINSG